MRPAPRFGTLCFGVLWCALVVGCSSGDVPTYEATGTVVFPDGTPLGGGSILFFSIDHDGKSARSQIGADGTFELYTYEPGDGAVDGQHTVAIVPPVPPGFDPDSGSPPEVIDAVFKTHKTSGLKYEVTAGEENYFEVKIRRPPVR